MVAAARRRRLVAAVSCADGGILDAAVLRVPGAGPRAGLHGARAAQHATQVAADRERQGGPRDARRGGRPADGAATADSAGDPAGEPPGRRPRPPWPRLGRLLGATPPAATALLRPRRRQPHRHPRRRAARARGSASSCRCASCSSNRPSPRPPLSSTARSRRGTGAMTPDLGKSAVNRQRHSHRAGSAACSLGGGREAALPRPRQGALTAGPPRTLVARPGRRPAEALRERRHPGAARPGGPVTSHSRSPRCSRRTCSAVAASSPTAGCACHAYGELALPTSIRERLAAAWQARVVERHDMLRAASTPTAPSGCCRGPAPYGPGGTTCAGGHAAERRPALAEVRERPAGSTPRTLAAVRVAVTLRRDRAVLHSHRLPDRRLVSTRPARRAPALHRPDGRRARARVTFRDYLLAERACRQPRTSATVRTG